MRRLPAILVLLSVSASACHPAQDGPEAAFRRFITNVQEGRVEDAWQGLAHGTQDALQAYVDRQRNLGADVPRDPRQALLGNATLARPIESLSVKQSGADKAVLSVTSGGVAQDVTMVKEEGTWRIALELPAS